MEPFYALKGRGVNASLSAPTSLSTSTPLLYNGPTPPKGESTLKAFITGIGGFAGRYLAEHLVALGYQVSGLVRGAEPPWLRDRLAGEVQLFRGDLTDGPRVVEVLRKAQPDQIYHLASQASIAESWKDPAATLTNNVVGTIHLLEGVMAAGLSPLILIVGSNEEYGPCSAEDLPTKETAPLRPINPYAISKVAEDLLGYQYFWSRGLRCVRVRPFTHIGPRQGGRYVVSGFAKQVAEAEAGLGPRTIRVGNLEAQRDFTDVRDMVRGYVLALERGEPGEVYNIGSGEAISIQGVLDFFLQESRVPLRVEPDPSRRRPGDVPITLCDATKFQSATGWQRQISLEQSFGDILSFWREAVRRGAVVSTAP